jgi:hypothetical protein
MKTWHINIIKTIAESPSDANKEVGLEVMQRKLYVHVSSPGYRTNHNIKPASKFFENAVKLKYLGMITAYQNCIHKKIKNRLILCNAYYHTVQNLLSSWLLPRI